MDTQEIKIYITVLVLCIILGTIGLLFYRSLLRQRKLNFELKKKNIVAEVNALESERSRIATDLHDEVGPVLAGIKLRINSIDFEEDDKEMINKTNEHIDKLLHRMREISFNLMPQALLRNGIVAAIEQLASFYNSDELEVTFAAEEGMQLPEQKAIHLYRIVQELFHNTSKHAAASELIIKLTHDDKKIVLTSSDNGKGFDATHPEKYAGFGLRSMFNRTEMLGGVMYLESTPGKGTRYEIEIPN